MSSFCGRMMLRRDTKSNNTPVSQTDGSAPSPSPNFSVEYDILQATTDYNPQTWLTHASFPRIEGLWLNSGVQSGLKPQIISQA